MTTELWSVVLIAGVLSLISPIAWRPLLARARVFDVPNQRSSHSKLTVRGGGLAPLTAVLAAGVTLLVLTDGVERFYLVSIVAAAALVSFVGLVEDISGLPAVIRAAGQFSIGAFYSVALSWVTESNWLWVPVAAVFFAANVNFTNFMDGVNGISSLHGVVVGLAFAWIGNHEGYLWLTVLGLLTAAIFATFFPWNLMPPGMFLGDSGSYLLGGLTGAMTIAAIWVGVNPIMAMAPLSIYWVDTVSTLGKRFYRNEPIFQAHRTHIYQQLTDHHFSHIAVATIVAAFTVLVSIAGVGFSSSQTIPVITAFLILAAIWITYLTLPSLMRKRKTSD